MAKVFLSYDRDDTERARPIALALEKAGHAVWWDLHVRGGAQFSKVIEEALREADAVVVLWSQHSIESAWVRDEAAVGRDTGRLIPATIDSTVPPLGFRQFQTIDLTGWKRGHKATGFKDLDLAIRELAGAVATVGLTTPPTASRMAGRRTMPWLIAAAAAGTLGLVAYSNWPARSEVPTVSVEAASNSSGSRALAGELFAKLGSLQSSNASALQLVESHSDADPELIFKVDGSTAQGQSNANLVLINGRNHSLLWSADFSQPANRQADLRQQLAYSAAAVLACASSAFSGDGKSLDRETRKLYLGACASFSKLSGFDPRALVPAFRKVVTRAPNFQSGWADLIMVEDDVLFSPPYLGNSPELRRQLKADIAAARRISPDLPEAYLAEADLLDQGRFVERMQLLDRAVEKNPNSDAALIARTLGLIGVGRMKEAVIDGRRAVQLSPFSSFSQDAYISALTYAGQFDRAEIELRSAESLWPGASNLRETRYRLDSRYGSASAALQQLRNGDLEFPPNQEAFLQARINPTPVNVNKAISASYQRYLGSPRWAADYVQTLGAFGKTDNLFQFVMGWRRKGDVGFAAVLFRPAFRDFWRQPKSMQAAAHLGLLDYWRTTGRWPDFCFEPNLPYDCKAEAAKLG